MLMAYTHSNYSLSHQIPSPPPPAPLPHLRLPHNKRCGWCRTFDTPQWRLGQSTGSGAMSTLCNACGINYRRALHKSCGKLDLDQLARAMGPSRPSIQKSIKRLRRTKKTITSAMRIGFDDLCCAPPPLHLVNVEESRSPEFISTIGSAPQSPVDVRTTTTKPLLPSIHVLLNELESQ